MFKQWRERRRFSRLKKADLKAAIRQSATERAARREAARTSPNLFDLATRGLVRIGERQGYLDKESGGYERTREIGQLLYNRGGHAAMLRVHAEVANRLPFQSRALEFAWDGIGEWLG